MEERPVAILDVNSNLMSIANSVDDMFTFKEDSFTEDFEDVPVVDTVTQKTEEPLEEVSEEESIEQEVVEDSEADEYKDYSKPALLGLALKEESDLFADLEIEKELDASNLITKITSNYSKKIEEIKQSIKSEYEQIADYIEIVKQGDTDVLKSGVMLDNILSIDLNETEDEAIFKQLISYSNSLKSIPQEDTDNLIETYLDKGILKDKALKSQQELSNYKSNLINSKLEEYRLRQEEEQRHIENIKTNVKTFLQSDPTIKSVVKDPDLIYKTMFEPTEVLKYKDEKGNSRVTKVPKMQLLMEEFQNNVQKQIIFTQLLLNNFSLDEITSIKEKKTTKQILNLLEDKPSTSKNKWVDKLN